MDNIELNDIVSELTDMARPDNMLSSDTILNHHKIMDLSIDEYEIVIDKLMKQGVQIRDRIIDTQNHSEASKIPKDKQVKFKKKPRANLVVKFSDGTIFHFSTAVEAFVKAIQHIGVARIKRLGLYFCDVPLIAEQTVERYASAQKYCDGYYIFTYNSTEKKKEILEKIASFLRLDISVEVIQGKRETESPQQLLIHGESDDLNNTKLFATQNQPRSTEKERKTRAHKNQEFQKKPKTNLKVTLPNGQVLTNPKALDTFVATIKFIGVERVRSLGLRYCQIPFIAEQTTPRYASAQKFCEGFYIFTYNSTDKKKEILETISEKLGVKLNVDIVSDYSR